MLWVFLMTANNKKWAYIYHYLSMSMLKTIPKSIVLSFILGLFFYTGNSQVDILARLQAEIPNASIKEIDQGHHFKREFIIMLEQPVDHFDPSAGTFTQQLFLAHYNSKEPMLMVTEGYSAYPKYYELSDMLLSNQLIIEHRYFGKSKPEKYNLKYLNNDQASEDYHRIRNLFGNIYKDDWISTGISKGGTSCLIYKSKYPDDVKVAIPYVAPLPMGREDKRCNAFLEKVGDESCRNKIKAFQHHALSQKEDLYKYVDSMAREESLHYTKIGIKSAIEYAILEYSFSFWQYGHACNRIPENSSPEKTFNHMKEVSGFDFFCDETIEFFSPAFYQFMTENGYYGWTHEEFKSQLEYTSDFTSMPFAPKAAENNFDVDYMKYVRVFLYHHGDKIIYIHGGLDPWSACKLIPPKERDAVLIISEKGDHTTRISTLSKLQQKIVYAKLSEWLDRKIVQIKK